MQSFSRRSAGYALYTMKNFIVCSFSKSRHRRLLYRVCAGLLLLLSLLKFFSLARQSDFEWPTLGFQGRKPTSLANQTLRPERSPLCEQVEDNRKKGEGGFHAWMTPRPLEELMGNIVPNTVHFVWCHNRTFTFKDYLSVLSVWKLLEPDIIEIHAISEMHTDRYNTWLSDLRRTVHSLVISKMVGNSASERCGLRYAMEVLSDRGGMFFSFSTVLTQSIHHLRRTNFSIAASSDGDIRFVLSQRKFQALDELLTRGNMDATTLLGLSSSPVNCASFSPYHPLTIINTAAAQEVCMTLPVALNLQPLDFVNIEDNRAEILKAIVWRELDNLGQRKSACPIPNIVHYIWFNSVILSFRMYLSFLSTLHVVKPDRIFIHTDLYLSGPYWQKIASHPNVTVVYREAPSQIFGHAILYTQHRSDIVRADVLDKFGGLYADWDVLWLRSPARLLTSGREALVNFDHMPRPPFSDVINLGVVLARPRSVFVRLWRQGLRQYHSEDFFYNALELPYRVYEMNPDTVYIEKRLQVMCFWLKCHPIFHKDHKDWNHDQPFDWRTDTYAVHFTHPDPEEYESMDKLMNSTGVFADIGKYILDRAGEPVIKL